MLIRKDIKLDWDGEEVKIPNSMQLANNLEMSGFNLLWIYSQTSQPVLPPVNVVASFIAEILTYGGKKASPDDVLSVILGDKSGEGARIVSDTTRICEELMPALKAQSADEDTKKKP